MATNDLIILNQILAQKRNEIAPRLSENEYFELFTAEQILKDYELSYDEIESGNVGKSADGGIDCIYTFINGELLHEDTDLSGVKKTEIELVLIQAKTSRGFSEDTLIKFLSVTEDLLNLSKPLTNFRKIYNEDVLQSIKQFRDAYETLAGRFPKLIISYYYATKGDISTINASFRKKEEKLKEKIKSLFSSSTCNVTFLGASELLEMARKSPQTSYSLVLAENPISSSGKNGFVCLVNLKEYFNFILDEQGNLRKSIFEANVRDYQGKTSVNEQIQRSLRNPHGEDFWWLNNGVTVLASQATLSGKTISIENPEIVNGLQTSAEIFNYFKEINQQSEGRNLLVRIVVPEEPEVRDRIIKATNSQTAISPASLRATDKIHRDIEEFFKPYGLYYDRRKNYYKNEGKPIGKIISIPYLAQGVMAIVLQRPDDARARPSSLLNRDDDYNQLFNLEYPIKIYQYCVTLLQKIEEFLKSGTIPNLDRKTRGDIKFHIATHCSVILSKKCKPSVSELSDIIVREIDTSLIFEGATRVLEIYTELINADPVASDKVAKSPAFRERVINDACQKIQK